MATYTTSALTAAFVEGASVFGKQVLDWNIRNAGIEVRTNVKAPQALTKLTADGAPRPYRIADDFNGATFTDRILTVYMGKYDMQLDAEDLRNKYLATLPEFPFEQFAVQQAAKQYLDAVTSSTLGLGVYNAAGTGAVDLFTGWLSIIAAEITATTIAPVVTGAITSANAVTKVEQVADAAPTLVKAQGFRVLCSYDVLSKYRIHYRTLNGFGFNKNERGGYQLDGVNGVLEPQAWMGTSQRLILTVDNNLVFGTDIEGISMHPTPYLNYLKTRLMMAGGCQIKDLAVLTVNDQA
jgi:hypothetical protein